MMVVAVVEKEFNRMVVTNWKEEDWVHIEKERYEKLQNLIELCKDFEKYSNCLQDFSSIPPEVFIDNNHVREKLCSCVTMVRVKRDEIFKLVKEL